MQHKRERAIEARIVDRRYCFGGDSKSGGQMAAPAPTPAPPPPDLGPDTARAQQEQDSLVARRKGAAYTQLTGPSGAADPTVTTPTLGGGTKALLG